jgi:nucleotide-binding universal stress UspA family protein
MTSAEETTTTRRQIVVGVDGSESSLAALRWAMRQAEQTGAALEIAPGSDQANGASQDRGGRRRHQLSVVMKLAS